MGVVRCITVTHLQNPLQGIQVAALALDDGAQDVPSDDLRAPGPKKNMRHKTADRTLKPHTETSH